MAEGKKYQPAGQAIMHLREFLRLSEETSGDIRYEELISQLENDRGMEKKISLV